MAAGDPVFGTRTALANTSRLHSVANNEARAFGEIDNDTTPKGDYSIHVVVPISSSATASTVYYELWMVESQDGAEWTDNIDPTADTGNVAAKIKDAVRIGAQEMSYNATTRTEVEFHFNIADYRSVPAPFFGFVWVNKSGQTSPASGADGDSRSIGIASA